MIVNQLIVGDVMTKQVTTCRPETNLAAASALMWENDCDALPLVAETGELAGILTDRDICIALGTRNARASELTARDVVGTYSLACNSADDIRFALQLMREAKIRHLPVVTEAGVLEGMVSVDDFLLSLHRDKAGAAVLDLETALQAIRTRDAGDLISNAA